MKRSNLYFAFTCAILLGALLLVERIEARVPVPLQRPLTSIPMKHEGFSGRDASTAEKNYQASTVDASVYRTYFEEGGLRPVHLYVGYWEAQDEAKKIKLPRYVFDGWGYYWMKEKLLVSPEWGRMPFKEFLNEDARRRELVYYSFVVNGKMMSNEYQLRIVNMLNALLHDRSNAAVIRVSSFLARDETVEEAEERVERFIK